MKRTARDHFMAIIYVGMMAAIIFVATYFFKFDIPTPTGPVMIKTANALCLLSGLLFGGFYGGLSAGIGSMLFDLMDPRYTRYAPFSLCFFFLMGFVCGRIAHINGAKGQRFILNLLATSLGALTYFALNAARNILELMFAGSGFIPAIIANSTKLSVSALNMVVGIILALVLQKAIHPPLKAAGILDRF